MSNPVEPAQYGAGEPNPGGQAFPPPNAGGAAYPPPNAGAPGEPGAYPAPGAYPPPGAAGFPPPAGPPAKSGGGVGKKILSILGVIAIAVVIGLVKFGVLSAFGGGDPTKDAKPGDCISVTEKLSDKETETEADIVDCGDSKAKFVVVGKVAGVDDVNSTACDTYFTEADKDPAILSNPKGAKDKYLLCVKAKA
jgi:hypothetical protein